jgi:transcriptional regulator with XRE-family HTH domain
LKKIKFLELRSQGVPYKDIAEMLKVSKQTLHNWAKILRHELANIETEKRLELMASIHAGAEGRIKNLVNILEKARFEMSKRSFENTPTQQLLALIFDLEARLKSEEASLVFSGPSKELFPVTPATETWRP